MTLSNCLHQFFSVTHEIPSGKQILLAVLLWVNLRIAHIRIGQMVGNPVAKEHNERGRFELHQR